MENETQKIKAQVMDLLNQIVILTKDFPEAQTFEDGDYQTVMVTEDIINDYDDEDLKDMGIDKSKFNADALYLRCVGDYAKRVVDGKTSRATHNEEQYYNSNCY